MPKKPIKAETAPQIVVDSKKTQKPQKKEDVIEVKLDEEDFLDPGGPNESLVPLMTQTLPVLKRSSDLSVQDPLSHYLKEISRHKLLTLEEEKELTAELLRTGDIDVAKRLVLANLRLVVKIAFEYKNAYKNIMDLIQEGNIGLMKAVSKYDPAKGAKLSYYASWWIRSYILKFILDNFRLVKIGTTQEQKKLFYNLMREKQRLMSLGVSPDVKLLSENLGVSEKAVIEMDLRLGTGGQEVSLDKPLDEDGGRHTLGDLIGDGDESTESKLADLQNLEILKSNLGDFIKNLKPRDQEIFRKRLLSEVPESLQSIADQYGVSRERIRQVEERLIEQLKNYMAEFIR
ncbi:MAG TPA: RNA polymerase factor sigma-32 [Bacteriovoracaceae bacterium]|nr:RNA polymerase factor sigma-32 [Bacteriovoracaceae bacterium]